jgi:hypothetical protein
MKRFLLLTKTGNEKWPLKLFSTDDKDAAPLESLADVKNAIKETGRLYYLNTNKKSDTKQFIYRSQISHVYGPYDIPGKNSLTLDQVMSLNEAVSRWKNIKNVDTIRKAITANRFHEWEVRKSESIWLITYGAMVRLFGPEDHTQTPDEQILQVQKPVFENYEAITKGKFHWEDVLDKEEGEESDGK